VDVYNYWSDAKAAADFIYNPTQFAGNVVKSSPSPWANRVTGYPFCNCKYLIWGLFVLFVKKISFARQCFVE